MAGHAEAWWEDLRQEAELPPEPPRRRKVPVLVGAVVAAVAAGGLGWWLSSPGQPNRETAALLSSSAPGPQAARAATATADTEQVRRAYEEFGLVYAHSGPDGLARFSDSCQQSLKRDPRILDFCLAFDLFADSVRVGADPAGQAEARRLALVQAALPAEADPDGRLREVRRLTRVVSGVAGIVEDSPMEARAVPEGAAGLLRASQPATALPAPAPGAARPARLAKADPARPLHKALDPCRFEATPADRLLCANPTLRRHETEIRQAYERALAAGADPLLIDRGQAEWRAARNDAETPEQLAASYARRVRELEAAAEAAPLTPPS